MILNSSLQTYQIAKEDITCYKHLVVSPNGEYRSCYYKHTWKPNVIYTSPLTKHQTYVYEGFHSYQTLKEAEDVWNKYMPVGTALVKCVIPKGACYYTGDYYERGDTYASDKLKMVEVIKTKGDIVNDSTFPYEIGDKIILTDPDATDVIGIDTIYAIFKYQCQYYIWFSRISKAWMEFLIVDENGIPIEKDLKLIKTKGE